MKVLAGDGRLGAVGQMAALAEIHAHDSVARLQQGKVHRHVGLRAGVGLYIGMLRAEELFRPLDGEGLHLVHILAAAVVACAGITLGVLVGQMAAHGLHHRRGDKVFRGNKLDMVPLASKLAHHSAVDLRVLRLDMSVILHGAFLPVSLLFCRCIIPYFPDAGKSACRNNCPCKFFRRMIL